MNTRCVALSLLAVVLLIAPICALDVNVRGVHHVASADSSVERLWRPQGSISMFRPASTTTLENDVGYGLVQLSTAPEASDASNCVEGNMEFTVSKKFGPAASRCKSAVVVIQPPSATEGLGAAHHVQYDLAEFCGASSGVVLHTAIEVEVPATPEPVEVDADGTTTTVKDNSSEVPAPTWSSSLFCPKVSAAHFTAEGSHLIRIPQTSFVMNAATHHLVEDTASSTMVIDLTTLPGLLVTEKLKNATSGIPKPTKKKSKKASDDATEEDEDQDAKPAADDISTWYTSAADIVRVRLGNNVATMRRETGEPIPSLRHLPTFVEDMLVLRTVELVFGSGKSVHVLLHSQSPLSATSGEHVYTVVSVLPVALAPVTAIRPYGGVSNKVTYFSLVASPTKGQAAVATAAGSAEHHRMYAQFTSVYRGTRWEAVPPPVLPSKDDKKKTKPNNVADGLEVRRYAAEPFSVLETGWFSVFYGGLYGRPGLSAYGIGGSSSPKSKVRNEWTLSSIAEEHNTRAELQRLQQNGEAADETAPLAALATTSRIHNFSDSFAAAATATSPFLCADPSYVPVAGEEHGCESSGLVEIVRTRNDTYYLIYDQLRGLPFGVRAASNDAKSDIYAMELHVDEVKERQKYDAMILRQKADEEAEKTREAQRVKYQEEIEQRKKEARRAKRKEERLKREAFERHDTAAMDEARAFAQENDGEWIVVREMRDEFVDAERNTF